MSKHILNTSKAPAPVGAYNQAVKASGSLLFISGQIAIYPETATLVLDDIEAETTQVMENIKAILNNAGLTFENVVKSSVFVTDINNYGLVNKVYSSYFNDDTAPARELVQVGALPKLVNVEISMIACTEV